MVLNLKTLAYFIIIVLVGIIPSLSNKLKVAREKLATQSEKSSDFYTGQLGLVYNPLDKAYVVTDELKELIKKESTLDFSRYQQWPVISIWVNPEDLYSKDRGILENFEKRGRLWERASFVTYYENGEKKFSSYAGLRLHGGDSRLKKYKEKSLRLHFRKSYGEPHFLEGLNITIGDDAPVKRLVLHKDSNHHFVADLSFSIVKQLGGIAPNIKPVVVYVNGELMGHQYMTEQLSEEQLAKYFGHNNFVFYKLKGDNDNFSHLMHAKLVTWIKYAPEPLDIEDFKSRIDIDNFTANILAIMYTGASDWAQGVIVKDLHKPNDKYRYIAWDFDRAFYPYGGISPSREHNWQIKSLGIVIENYRRALRSRILRRLFEESPEYVAYFSQKVDEMFEEKLTYEFFNKKFAEYEKLVKDSGLDPAEFSELNVYKEFVKNRKKVFCQDMQKYLKTMASTCF